MSSPVSTFEQAVLALAEQRPLLRARDLAEQGLPTMALSRLVASGKLNRVARGVYSLPGRALSENRSLAEVALRIPQGIVCLLSALQVHGIGTQAPFEVWVEIPHNSPTPRLHQPALRAIRMSGPALSEGVEPMQIDGVNVPVFKCSQDHCRLLQIPQQDRLGRRAGSATRRMDAAQGDS
jgi:predicted transcriptional regulator of viral defense system